MNVSGFWDAPQKGLWPYLQYRVILSGVVQFIGLINVRRPAQRPLPNQAINSDSQKRRAFVAPLLAAGYGERWALISATYSWIGLTTSEIEKG